MPTDITKFGNGVSVAQLSPFRLPDTPARTDLVAKYFRALGDPTRLRILELLRAEGELSAGELTRRLAQPQPRVSNHLACLRWCGFVDTRSAACQQPARQRPLIEVLTFPDCPNRDGAVALAARVRDQLGSAAEVRVIDVADQSAAEQGRFPGS